MATSVVSAMLVAGMAMPSLAVNSATEVRYSEKYLSSPAIAIDLKSGERDLSREELATLVSDRYNTTLVSVADEDGSTVTSGNVGTDYEARLGNGKYAKVVLYGDLNSDGIVDLRDANILYQTYTSKATLREVLAKAGDLTADGAIDLRDANRAYNYYTRSDSAIVADLDKLPEQEVLVSGEFVVTPVDQYVNNINVDEFKTTLSMKQLDTAKKAQIYCVNEDGTLGNLVTTSPAIIPIPAYTSQMSLPDMNLTSIVDAKDGIYKFRLVEVSDSGNKIGTLADFTLDARTNAWKTLSIVGLKGNRPSSSTGSVSLSVVSEDEFVKAYYVEKERSNVDTKVTPNPQDTEFEKDGKMNSAKSVEMKDNRIEEAPISDLKEDTAYDVWFRFEDKYGNVTDVRGRSALIPWEKDTATTIAPTIVNATMTNFDTVKTTDKVELKWEVAEGESISGETFCVVIYKDGKAIAQKTGVSGTSTTLDQFSLDITPNTALKPTLDEGEYYFEVYAEGNNKKLPSATIKSNTSKVTRLNAVDANSIKFDVDKYNKSQITWSASSSSADTIKDYKIELYAYNSGTKDYTDLLSISPNTTTETKYEELATMAPNTLYKAKVTTEASGDKLSVISSEEAVSKEFFKVYTPVLTSDVPTSTSAKFQITARPVSGITPSSYNVKVFLVNPDDPAGLFDGKLIEDTSLAQDVTVKSDGTFEVKGLKESTKYEIRLFATVDGIEGASEYSSTISTTAPMPVITGKHVVADNTVNTKSGEIAKTADGISLDGIEYKTADYPAELAEIQAIVDALVDGDEITYTTNKVSVKLGSFGNSTSARDRDLGTTLGNRDIEITNGRYSQTVSGTIKGTATINGNDQSLDITGLTTSGNGVIKINEGSTIKGATKVVVVANEGASPVNFMDKELKVNVSVDTTVDVTAPVKIAAEPNNNITINSASSNAVNVVVDGDGTDTNSQTGKIDIVANGGVTVTANSLALYANINVNVTSGTAATVDLTGTNLLGAQTVTVTNTSTTSSNITVKAKAAKVAPFVITSAIDIKEYKNADVATISSSVTGLSNADTDIQAANLAKLNEYLKSFESIYGTEYDGVTTKYSAKLKAKGNDVEISIGKTVDAAGQQKSVTIDGLKK